MHKVSLDPAYLGQPQFDYHEKFKRIFVHYRLPYRIEHFPDLVQSMTLCNIRQWYAQQSINCSSTDEEQLNRVVVINGSFEKFVNHNFKFEFLKAGIFPYLPFT